MQHQIQAIVCCRKLPTNVPIFSVLKCTNPAAAKGESFGYSTFVTETQTAHGHFDLPSGIFTVKTAGNYQLNFNTHVGFTTGGLNHGFALKINDKIVAASFNSVGYQPVGISALVSPKTGDKIGIFALRSGELYQSYATNPILWRSIVESID